MKAAERDVMIGSCRFDDDLGCKVCTIIEGHSITAIVLGPAGKQVMRPVEMSDLLDRARVVSRALREHPRS